MRAQLLALAIVLSASAALAQSQPAGESSVGSVKDGSRSLGDGSGTIGEASSGSVRSGPLRDVSRPVRDGKRAGMRSGPVSELGAGPVGDGNSMYGGGSLGASSRGAVTQPDDLRPLRMERPVTEGELLQLEKELRDVEPLPSE